MVKKAVYDEYKSINKSVRYRILKRDKYTCQYCGAAAGEDGVKLEVDHIIPKAKGGLDGDDNLITLCRDCNRGKSDDYAKDDSMSASDNLRIYFSGSESGQHYNCATQVGVPHLLLSYLYVRKQKTDVVKERHHEHPEQGFMIDSGAFTLRGKDAWEVEEYEEYVEEYYNWLVEHKDFIDLAVELDIDYHVGTTVVNQWQEKYFRKLEEEHGIPVVYVWQEERGMAAWHLMCQKHSYVGIPGDAKNMLQMFAIARQYLAKVHVFGLTSESFLLEYPVYSCDSISWKMGEIFGDSFFWNGREMHRYKDKNIRLQYRSQLIAMGCNFGKIMAEDNSEVTKMNLLAFKRMEADLSRRFSSRSYWNNRLPEALCYNVDRTTAEEVYAHYGLKEKFPSIKLELDNEEDEGGLETAICSLAIIQNGLWKLCDDPDHALMDWDTLQACVDTYVSGGYSITIPEDQVKVRLAVNGRMVQGGMLAIRRAATDMTPSFAIHKRESDYNSGVAEDNDDDDGIDFYQRG